MTQPPARLPDFENPPVVEIIAAVQFAPIPAFEFAQVVALCQEFADWTPIDAPPAIPPIAEGPGTVPSDETFFAFGSPPRRLVLTRDNGRWTGQVQQDRVAVHERKTVARPSFQNVAPMLKDFAKRAGAVLDADLFADPHTPDLVEVVYDNRIAAADGGWKELDELHRVLRILSASAGEPPYSTVERATVAFSYFLGHPEAMEGRLHVIGNPEQDENGLPVLSLRIISRRFVRDLDVEAVLEACHADIVSAFASVTTRNMHEVWGRYQ
jgi:uncharacterized protein (TIGR04255 family)